MKNAAQIRRRSGALRANRSRFRPSFLPPPPDRHPKPRISNRETLRLEINVTQTKQTTQSHSNREAEALFSNRVRADHSSRRNIDRPVRRSNLKISNREPLRRVRADDSARRNDDVIDVTQTKQTTQPHPNREAEALFSNRDLNLENSNRESRRSN
jgi:hypothetical protein